jgi:alpha-tubulin suppressor-like RCC1 family protein
MAKIFLLLFIVSCGTEIVPNPKSTPTPAPVENGSVTPSNEPTPAAKSSLDVPAPEGKTVAKTTNASPIAAVVSSEVESPVSQVATPTPTPTLSPALALAPLAIPALKAQIETNLSHTCYIYNDGKLKCFGNNINLQLGYTFTTQISSNAVDLPYVDLGTNRTARQVALGSHFTCALLDNGAVKCWGSNTNGQVAQGVTTLKIKNIGDALPAIALGETAVQITSGSNHACALMITGEVKCWGLFGDVKIGTAQNTLTTTLNLGANKTARQLAASISSNRTCVALNDQTVKCWTGAEHINKSGDEITAISLGTNVVIKKLADGCALLTTGGVKCWGTKYDNLVGESVSTHPTGDDIPYVNFGSSFMSVADLSVSNVHTCVVTTTGQAKCWGSNNTGVLGQDLSLVALKYVGGNVSTQIVGATTYTLTPYDDMDNDNTFPFINIGSKTAASINAGSNATCLTYTDGKAVCWGKNDYYRLGRLEYGDGVITPNVIGDKTGDMASLIEI